MMRKATIALALFAVGAAPAPVPMGLSVSSWGKLLGEWEIQPDGSIRYTAAAGNVDPQMVDHYTLQTKQSGPDPTRYARIAELLAPGHDWLGRDLPCKDRVTDMPYGIVHWGKDTLTFDSGCRDAGTAKIVENIHDADDQIEQWMMDAPVVATRDVGQ
jgi:hypothetical protein